ncbi:MAG: TerB family tellurite resistance protein [Candidatus Binatia bacterium]
MRYRFNLGCLWLFLLILVLGGTPLLVGVLRVFAGFILFALVGGLVLSWWIRRYAVVEYTRTRQPRTRRFVELLVGILVRLTELDGGLDRREVTAIRHFFQESLGYHDEQLLWIRDLIKAARRDPTPAEELCDELRAQFGLQERLIALQVLSRVAAADGAVTPAERTFIEEVARRLGLGPFVHGFSYDYQAGSGTGPGTASPGSGVQEAYSTLGLAPGVSREEVKQAWRKLSLENHPDRVTHLGEEFQRLAEDRMRKINGAYETLKAAGLAG